MKILLHKNKELKKLIFCDFRNFLRMRTLNVSEKYLSVFWENGLDTESTRPSPSSPLIKSN
jgi:hypothetical protein